MSITYIMSKGNISKSDLLAMYNRIANSDASTPQLGFHPEYVQSANGKVNKSKNLKPSKIKPSRPKFMDVEIKKGGAPDVYGNQGGNVSAAVSLLNKFIDKVSAPLSKKLYKSMKGGCMCLGKCNCKQIMEEYDGKGIIMDQKRYSPYFDEEKLMMKKKGGQMPLEYGSRDYLKQMVLNYLVKDAKELNRNRSLSILDLANGYQDESMHPPNLKNYDELNEIESNYKGSIQTPDLTNIDKRKQYLMEVENFQPPMRRDEKAVINPRGVLVPELNMRDRWDVAEKGVASQAEFDKTHGRGLVGARMKKVKNPNRVAKGKQNAKGNNWINFVKEYAAQNGMKYSDCIKDPQCKRAYRAL